MSLPFSMTKRLGAWLITISTPSSSASSSSQGEALKKPRGRRAMTLMSLPPRRREERQQSMAVLPTPMIRTRSPILSMCPKATEPASRCRYGCGRYRGGRADPRSLPRGAPLPTKTASKSCVEQRPHALDGRVVADLDAHVEDVVDLFGRARCSGSRKDGMLVRIRPPGLSYLLEDRDVDSRAASGRSRR